ncbi:methionine ABC transporter permease [Endozoicomonas montiporae]|uniref:Methionine ABC transporter permease n=2 Tax=Endozoicomonas montiporae TaxID=1027273 RepID=A0A081N608_9GAMM|nr:methionine ABC transporter permease [Endozoicomonas montiporae]AMO57202.1 D-methionine transport system permease protein [Endozoicomonas montiporae CL-33]KEQ13881.1 methionine ABC transporter permease [Endozoicomonas montiporae]
MSADSWALLARSLWETIYMTGLSGLMSFVFGIPLGVLLYITKPGRFMASPLINMVLGAVVNATRSVPFIILMVAIIPLTRMLVGTSIGTTAAIVPLTLAAIPFVARIAEGAINEVPGGLIEAAQAMGATPLQIITRVLLPEARPGLINGMTITLVTLVGYSAMAGAIGGGGLGDLGIRYGYQRFDGVIMLATVVVLIVLVQLVQSAGDRLQTYFDRSH